MSQIDRIPAPLLDDFLRGRWLPIVGAGFSRNAELPHDLSMPDWNELGEELSRDIADFQPLNAVDAISAYEEEHQRRYLVDRLAHLLHQGVARPGAAHRAFTRTKFDLVMTTNFDDLLEQAFADIGQPCQVLLLEEHLPKQPSSGQTQLLKLHGDLDHSDDLVATEGDFDRFLDKFPLKATFAANLLITRTPVFLGYSFDDPDTRAIWSLIRDRLGEHQTSSPERLEFS